MLQPALIPAVAWLLVSAAVWSLGGCGGDGESARARPEGPVRVVCTIPPLAGLVRGLLPDDAEVTVLVPPGRTVHGFELTPADVRSLIEADLVLSVGLGLEMGVETTLRRHPRSWRHDVVFADAVGIDAVVGHEGHHEHGHEECDHGPVDPHLWLDPELCQVLLAHVRDTLIEMDPALAERAGTGAAEMSRQIGAFQERVESRLGSVKGVSVVTQHNAYARLFRHAGVVVAGTVQVGESLEPAPGVVAELIETIEREDVRAVFLEPQMPAGVGRRLAARAGVPVGTLDPLGDGDWLGMMRSNVDELERVLVRGE